MKLHIGAGEKFLPGYKHMDVINRPHIDYVGDVRNLSFLEDSSVDEIYACHVLEHINRPETVNVLTEWYRVLNRGGGNKNRRTRFLCCGGRISAE